MSVLTDNFEEFKLSKLLNITQLDLAMPLLTADFGDGYGAGVLSGKASGLRYWTIGSECLPDQDAWSIDYTVDGDDFTDTRFQYLWEFYRRHQALGNKPFYFIDPRTNQFFLASFVDIRISFSAMTAKLYSGELAIKQRRVILEGIVFDDEDGAIHTDRTPPEPATLAGSRSGETITYTLTDPGSDDDSGISGYRLILYGED